MKLSAFNSLFKQFVLQESQRTVTRRRGPRGKKGEKGPPGPKGSAGPKVIPA